MTKVHVLLTAALFALAGCSQEALSPVGNVDVFIGTDAHGHVYPGATTPFGMVQLSPDTKLAEWDGASGYHYSDNDLFGFSHTHLSGTGCIDLGDVLFRPSINPESIDFSKSPVLPKAKFSHSSETAVPGYYSVVLEDGIKAELTASTHTGVHRYTFPADSPACIVIDINHNIDNDYIYRAEQSQTSASEICGVRETRGWADHQTVYFVAQFSQEFESAAFSEDKRVAVLKFKDNTAPVIAKVGISSVSEANARANMEAEVKDFDFDSVKDAAYAKWSDILSSIKLEGVPADKARVFYTALYHSFVVPNQMNDVNGEYLGHDLQVHQLEKGQKMYSTLSLWDTFRAWNPLMTILQPQLVSDMVNSMLNMYDATAELPIWPLYASETGTMIGYHSVSVIYDAFVKGIGGFDAYKALEAMAVSAKKNKKGARSYIEYGYIPSDNATENISCLLEYSYDDWCIAMMAKELGREDIYNEFIVRSQSYQNVFDGLTRFFRGKRFDGNWSPNFNPSVFGRDYTEATPYQYRFFAPHDTYGLIQMFGSEDCFRTQLDSLFVAEAAENLGAADITGLIGQYAHGNEPSHNFSYIYNYLGEPWKTQQLTRRIIDELYTDQPDGLCGNEDCGQMSAWYIFSALGFYPYCPGSQQYLLTTPISEKATISLPNGKTLIIKANQPQKNKYISKVTLNGEEITETYITHEQILQGGELVYTLCSDPGNGWGTKAEKPYSFNTEPLVSTPFISKDVDNFIDTTEIELGSTTEGASIYYTLDGSAPDASSNLYTEPLILDKSVTIRAIAYKEGYQPSHCLKVKATKAEFKEPVKASASVNGCNFTYHEGEFKKCADIEKSPVLQKGILPAPSIKGAGDTDHFGYIFTGYISVPEDGVYIFQTTSDDGSVLFIDGELVVNNDGSHAFISSIGKTALRAGLHNYKLIYMEDYEGQNLAWGWQLPSSKKMSRIPAEVLFVK